VAAWTHDQALLFLPPAALLLALGAARGRCAAGPGSLRPAGVRPLGTAAVRLLLGIGGFAAGYLPLWLPRVVSFALGPPGTEGTGWEPDVSALFSPAAWGDALRFFPAALTPGARPPGATGALLGLFATAWLVFAAYGLADAIRASRRAGRPLWSIDAGLVLTGWLAAGNLGAFLATPAFREDPQWFRYTLPATPFLALAAARGLAALPRRASFPAAGVLAAIGAWAALQAPSGWDYPQARLRPALARALRAEGVREVISDWQLAYFLRFVTRDAILASSCSPPRFPEVNARVHASPAAWFAYGRGAWEPRTEPRGSATGGDGAPGRASAGATQRAGAPADAWADLREAFVAQPRGGTMDVRPARALAGLDPRRTLYVRFEPFPLLRDGEFRRDWRGWPYRRPLESFTAVVWDPACPALVADSLLKRRLHELQESGRFATAASGPAGTVLVRTP